MSASAPYALVDNPDAYCPPGRWFWRVLLFPWVFMSAALPLAVVYKLVQGQPSESLELLAFAALFGAVVILMTWLFYGRPILHWHLARQGASADGLVTKTRYYRFARGPKHYVLYRFTGRGGREHSGREIVPADAFSSLRVGEALQVWYWRGFPLLNVPVRYSLFARRQAT